MNFQITGTHVWYYCICKRQVWLISRQIEADPEHELLELGRLIDQTSYVREKRYLYFEGGVADIYKEEKGQLIVSEIKKSSRFLNSARMQLLYYLFKLKELGFNTSGIIRIPKEKKVVPVELKPEDEEKIQYICTEIEEIVSGFQAPSAVLNKYCKNCAYFEFCWS